MGSGAGGRSGQFETPSLPLGTRRRHEGRNQDQADPRSGAASVVREPSAEALRAVWAPGKKRAGLETIGPAIQPLREDVCLWLTS